MKDLRSFNLTSESYAELAETWGRRRMRKTLLYVAALTLMNSFFAHRASAQTLYEPTRKQVANLNRFLREYLEDPSYDYLKTRYYASFVGLKDDGTQQVIVYFTDSNSCGSGGCSALVLTPKESSYAVVTSITIVRLPMIVLQSKSNGWHDLGVYVQGGGIAERYEAKLSFDGKTYPRNPTVPPAERLRKKEQGKIVVPLNAEGRTLDQN